MDAFQTDITPWKNNARAALTLSFDGAYAATHRLAMKVLTKYQMPATWFVVTGSVGEYLEGLPVASWTNLKEMSTQAMEIGSHTVTHPKLALRSRWQLLKYVCSCIGKAWKLFTPGAATKLRRPIPSIYEQYQEVDYRGMFAEAVESKNMIERYLSQQVASFAYPGGRYNSELEKGIKEAGYICARSTDHGYNFLDSLDFYALKSKIWNITVDADQANKWADFAVERGAWIIETYHVVSQNGATGYYWDTAVSDLDAHLSYIASQDIWVDTQKNITKYIKERNAAKIKLDIVSDKKIVLLVESDLDPKTYDQALTLKTAVPTTWSEITITQAGNIQQASPRGKGNERYIHYNALPNNGEIILTHSER